MLAYERHPWTDEHLNPTSSPAIFELPEVEGGLAKWRWVEGSEWHVDVGNKKPDTTSTSLAPPSKGRKSSPAPKQEESEDEAWVYYDNKWRDGRRGQDGWGRYTRRRKWLRDAELVDVDPAEVEREHQRQVDDEESARQKERDVEEKKLGAGGIRRATELPVTGAAATAELHSDPKLDTSSSQAVSSSISTSFSDYSSSPTSTSKSRSWFSPRSPGNPGRRSRAVSSASASGSGGDEGRAGGGGSGSAASSLLSTRSSVLSRAAAGALGDDVITPTAVLKERESEWGLGDDVHMTLG